MIMIILKWWKLILTGLKQHHNPECVINLEKIDLILELCYLYNNLYYKEIELFFLDCNFVCNFGCYFLYI